MYICFYGLMADIVSVMLCHDDFTDDDDKPEAAENPVRECVKHVGD